MRLDEDIAKLRDRDVEVIFTPNVMDIYPTAGTGYHHAAQRIGCNGPFLCLCTHAEDSFPARVDFAGIEAVDGEGKERPG